MSTFWSEFMKPLLQFLLAVALLVLTVLLLVGLCSLLLHGVPFMWKWAS